MGFMKFLSLIVAVSVLVLSLGMCVISIHENKKGPAQGVGRGSNNVRDQNRVCSGSRDCLRYHSITLHLMLLRRRLFNYKKGLYPFYRFVVLAIGTTFYHPNFEMLVFF